MSSSERGPGDPGDPGAPAAVRTDGSGWLHFAGVAGTGMSALAQLHALQAVRGGGTTTGSDRALDRGEQPLVRRLLERTGVRILPQTGEAWDAATAGRGVRCDAVIASTAVEDTVADVAAARALSIPVLHRSELLEAYVRRHRTIAVTGTSGKSTVTAMIFTILRECGWGPGLLTGGPLADLTRRGLLGNAWAPDLPPPAAAGAGAPWLVIEADESDGSLVRYHPQAAVILNLGLDHKPPAQILAMFRTFAAQTSGPVILGDQIELADLRPRATRFGVRAAAAADAAPDPAPGLWAEDVRLLPTESRFTIDGTSFVLPHAGLHNVLNAAAAVAACAAVGLPPGRAASALAGFAGVSRRFESAGKAAGVEVIDDFAHNPDKIAAALAAARPRLGPGGRILAVFQPHGFGPTRFLREALAQTFAQHLGPQDLLLLAEIFFAGGTVVRDIGSADLAADVRERGRQASFVAERADIAAILAGAARPGDVVLVMGARDPSLSDLCRAILLTLREREGQT